MFNFKSGIAMLSRLKAIANALYESKTVKIIEPITKKNLIDKIIN